MTENGNEDPRVVELSLQGRLVTFNIDTGTEVTVVTEKTWRQIGQPKLERPERMLRGPDSHVICTLGKFIGSFEIGAHQARTEVFFAKGLARLLLGRVRQSQA